MIIILLSLFAGTAMPRAHAEPVVSMESLLERPMDSRVREMKALGDHAHQFLSKTAFDHSESLQTRWRAVTTMGRWDALAFKPELDRALASGEWFMRNAALIALLNDDRARAVSWSTRMLNDPALVVRTQAVRNLIGLNAIESLPQLWRA